MGLFDNLGGTMEAPASLAATEPVSTPPATPEATPAAPAAPAAQQVPATPAPDAQSQVPNNAPPAAAPAAQSTQEQQVDYGSIFDKMSGGIIKSEDDFKATLTDYQKLKQSNQELSAKMAAAPVFADDEVRILNELKASGASKEQIKSFQKINEYGNISEMPDRDAIVAKMVMVDGVKPSVAELKVDRLFQLGDESLSEEEREILNDDMRVAALNDRKALEKFKAAVINPNNLPPEEAQLAQQSKLAAHQATLKPYVKDIMTSLPHLGEFTLSAGKDGVGAVKYQLPIDDSIKEQLGQYVENWFMDGVTPVTPENTREAMAYARAEYFKDNAEKLFQSIYEQGVSNATEATVNKYENRSGLKPQSDNPVIGGVSDEQATASFMQRVANRNV